MFVNYNKLTAWTPEKVLFQLETNDDWTEKALLALYNKQTDLEKRCGVTIDDNEKGLQQADAKLFGILAKKLLRGEHLAPSEFAEIRRPWHRGKTPVITIGKYRKQIVAMIEAKAKQKLEAAR